MPAANASTEARGGDRAEARTRWRFRRFADGAAYAQGRLSLAVPWMSVVVVDLD